jgi:DNA-binding transcriptional ArsR family regulator
MKKILWWLIAGTKGGPTRGKIIEALSKSPANANKLTEQLGYDYKTIRHHLDVLRDNKILTVAGDKYGAVYFLSEEMENRYEEFLEIWNKVKKNSN